MNKIKDLIYKVFVEIGNELDYGYESDYKKDLKDNDLDMLDEFLWKVHTKLELILNDELKDILVEIGVDKNE